MKRFLALVLAGIASIGTALAAVNANTASREDLEVLKDIAPAKAQAIVDGVLDINTASEHELKQLPGVGTLRAKAIVKGRPYRSKEELVEKHILPESIYDGVKDRIIARHEARTGG